MAKTKQNIKTIEMPVLTVKALKGLLFSSEEGVDLSAIIDDLSVGQSDAQRDINAINVGLTFKGMKPQINTEDKFSYAYNNIIYKYYYADYSLIKGEVTYNRLKFKIDSDGNEFMFDEEEAVTIKYGDDDRFTTLEDAKQKAIAYNKAD